MFAYVELLERNQLGMEKKKEEKGKMKEKSFSKQKNKRIIHGKLHING